LDEEQKMLYIETLKEGVTPFDRFVSRADTKDMVDVSECHKMIDTTITKLLKIIKNDHTTRFLPIVGGAGSGKTHLYWALKERSAASREFYIIYVPSPPAPVRMLYHIYSCLMNDLGDTLLKEVASKLVKKYGGSYQKIDPLGLLTLKRNPREIQAQARKDFSGLQSEFVRTLITFYMRGLNWKLAEQWLLGEALPESDLNKLSVSRVIEEDDIVLACLKVLTSQSERPVIFYFDELEIPYNSFGPEAEVRLLSVQKRMYNEIPNSLIIVACLSDIWPRVVQITDSAMRSRMEMDLELQPFTFADTQNLYVRAMEHFWDENNLPAPSDKFLPLNEGIFKLVFQKTKGNPRDSIKMLKVFIDQILADESLADHFKEQIEFIEKSRVEPVPLKIEQKTEPVPLKIEQKMEPIALKIEQKLETMAAPPVETPLQPVESNTPREMGEKILSNLDQLIEAAVKKKEEQFEAELAEKIEVTPATAVSAAVDSILTFAKERKKDIRIDFNFEFPVEGKPKSISVFLLDIEGHKIGIDIPTIKSFDKSAGVAAYYSIIRLKQAVEAAVIDHACLITPKETGGKKFLNVCEELGTKLTVIELNEDDAKELIRNAKANPSRKGREFARLIFKDVPLEPPPPVTEGQQPPTTP